MGGVEVTSDNKDNVTGGDISSGTVTYNPTTKTLTLTNVTISRSGSSDRAVHNRSCEGLTIVLAGACTFTGSGCSTLYFQKSTTLNVTGSSSVTCTSSGDDAIYMNNSGTLTISGTGTLSLNSSKGEGIEGNGNGSLTFAIGKCTINSGRANLKKLASVTFRSSTRSDGGSMVYLGSVDYNYTHLENVTTVNMNGNMSFKEPTDITTAGLSSSSYYNTPVYIGYYAFRLSSSTFLDPHFLNFMKMKYPQGYMTTTDVKNLKTLTLNNQLVYNMSGVELLTNLDTLDISYNLISNLDLTKNTSLKTLACVKNNIVKLKLSNLTNLKSLFCSDNKLTSIDLTGCSTLSEMVCANNAFTNLTLYNLPSLTKVILSNSSEMTVFTCSSNPSLRVLNISDCTSLKTVYCHSNKLLYTIDMSGCSALESLNCQENALLTLWLGNTVYPSLRNISCYSNKLTSIDVSRCTGLTGLYCYNNNIGSEAMETIVNALLDASRRSESGTLFVLYEYDNNVFNEIHIPIAYAKNWIPYRYKNSDWHPITLALRGDLNEDGTVNSSDASVLYEAIINGSTDTKYDITGDGDINAADVSALYEIIISQKTSTPAPAELSRNSRISRFSSISPCLLAAFFTTF